MTDSAADIDEPLTASEDPGRKRAWSKPGERRTQILQALAGMLEHPKGEKITTAALAARIEVSEAALYRHFASKAQMYEALIEFIETTLFGLVNRICAEQDDGLRQAHAISTMLLRFAEQNRGMTRVLIGDALVGEHERLQMRINVVYDRLELALKQSLRVAATQSSFPEGFDPGARAALVMSAIAGAWLRFAKSGWQKSPVQGWDQQGVALFH